MNINFKKSFILIIFLAVLLFIISPSKVFAFEKNIKNATGFGAVKLNIREQATSSSRKLGELEAGTPFRIISESNNYWKVIYNGNKQGYVYHPYCMINLPDVEPSIIYNITNAESSIYKSSGYNLPNITGEKLYAKGKVWNERLERYEYIVPVSYATAKRISKAQENAMKDGYTLKIYDAYRPSGVTAVIRASLNNIYKSSSTVKYNIDYSFGKSGKRYNWGQRYFLAQCVSKHNTGSAIDVTLANASTKEELEMPTAMHELSTKAIKYYSGTVAKIPANYSKEMNANAKKLDKYCTSAGLTTIPAEWWHFQDVNAHNKISSYLGGRGCYFQVSSIVSAK